MPNIDLKNLIMKCLTRKFGEMCRKVIIGHCNYVAKLYAKIIYLQNAIHK